MGADVFFVKSEGLDAAEAFTNAVEDALCIYGSRGYTGSIAEKKSFVMIEVPEGEDPVKFARGLILEDDPRVCDKWGDAGCIRLGKSLKKGSLEDVFIFFGLAPS